MLRFSKLLNEKTPIDVDPCIDLWARSLKQSIDDAIKGDKNELKWWKESPALDWICECMGFDSCILRKLAMKKIERGKLNEP